MKTLIYIAIAVALGACRSMKEKERRHYDENWQQQNEERYRSFYLWDRTDSTARYWQYSGDTVFYYHPEEGLWAGKGHLWVQESKQTNGHAYSWQDSHSAQEQVARRAWAESVNKVITQNWKWGMLLIAVFVILAYAIRRSLSSIHQKSKKPSCRT